MRAISYAPASSTLRVSPRTISVETVQDEDGLTEHYTRIFTEPFDLPLHGTRVTVPEFASVVRHIKAGDYKMPNTLAKLTLGYRRLNVTRPMLCGMFYKAAAVAASTYPAKVEAIEDLNELETRLQGEIDQFQNKLWRKDYSAKTLKDFLDGLYRMRDAIDRMIEWAETKLYGERQ
jgi:hypothetical protein